jgi:hypothetical protein
MNILEILKYIVIIGATILSMNGIGVLHRPISGVVDVSTSTCSVVRN